MCLPPPVPNGFNDWESIEFPQFLKDLGFEDYSYHNDLCARAQKPLAGYTDEEGFPCLIAWCEHAKPEDREETGGNLYDVYLHVCADVCSDNFPLKIYGGEDAVACEAAIRALDGRVAGFCDEGASFGTIVARGFNFLWVLFDKEDWRSYERPDGAVRYELQDGEYVTPDGASGVVILEVK